MLLSGVFSGMKKTSGEKNDDAGMCHVLGQSPKVKTKKTKERNLYAQSNTLEVGVSNSYCGGNFCV